MPIEHGHFSFYIFSPATSPFGWTRTLAWLPSAIADRPRVRNVLSRWVARFLGYTGYFQLYRVPFARLPYLDYTEKKDIYLPGGINGGQQVIFTLWDELDIPWFRSDWRIGDKRNVANMMDVLAEGKVRCAYLFTANLDAVMHQQGTQGYQTDRAFAQLEEWIRELRACAAKRYQEVRIHVFSDHGMTDTSATSDMRTRFQQLGYEYGKDYAAVWDSTMVRFWFLRPELRENIVNWLRQQPEGAILTDEQMERWGCLFADRRFGELFYLLKPGTIFVPSAMGGERVAGMHGFSPEDPNSKACWLTSHPTRVPRRIEEIFLVMKEAAERVAAESA
jgi:predicted AlkP superfamily pyrophosphatase or phosphodiesterase